MELFAAAADDKFPVPNHVAPFPDSGDLLYAAIPPALRHNPQKLRPIRSAAAGGGKSSSPPPLHDAHFCLLDGQLLEPSDNPHDSLLPTDYPVGSGSRHADGRPVTSGQEPGSSLDDDGDNDDGNSSGSAKEPGSTAKRRRKTKRNLEVFVENLVRKLMEKQEQMHKQLVDMIEKKERERVMREEAWKLQEMERIKKDEEARAQERSRSLALISFIQNLLGHEINVPRPAEVSIRREEDEHEAEANIQKNFNSDASNNRWPDVEVQALITVRTSMEHKFGHMGSKVSIWEEISEAMQDMGYNRSAKKCKEKWENINKYYKRTMGSGKKRRQNSKSRPYFNELDNLHRNGLLNLGNALSNTNDVPKIEKE